MAATKIADVIVPKVFNPYVTERSTQLSALFESGIIATVPELNVFGMKGGTTVAMPFWKDLTGAEEILSDVVPLGVDKITSNQDIAVLHARGKAWGVNDLAEALSGDDPMAEIASLVGGFWARRWQAMLLSILDGVFKSPSMAGNVSDISAGAGDAAVISANTIVDALYKLGDASSVLTAFAMHSAVVAKLVKDQLIEFRPDADGSPTLPYYMGKRIIEDDSMPVNAGVYTSYLFGAGAIGYADGGAPTPTETDRDSLAGEDILINRRHFVMHPRGVAWIGTSTGVSPTNTELATGTNWDRRYDTKNIRIVQFKHKIA
jgi:Major capsid protein 13-like